MIAHIRKALAVLILLAAVVGAGSSANAHGSVSCGDVLTTSTTLKADLACDVNALRVGADGIVIDLNGHTITARPDGSGAYPAYGVDNSGGYDQVVVKDGSIAGFGEAAVYFDQVQGSTVRRIRFDHNRDLGLRLVDSGDNDIRRNTIIGGRIGIDMTSDTPPAAGNRIVLNRIRGDGEMDIGVRLRRSHNNVVSRNTVTGVNAEAIVLNRANDNLVTRNTLRDNGFAGINLFRDSDANVLRRNTIVDNGRGVLVQAGSEANVIAKNVIRGARVDVGLTVQHSDLNVLKKNRVTNNPERGISIFESDSTRLWRNVSKKNGADGIRVWPGSDDTVLSKNRSHHNGENGIRVENATATLKQNRANNNALLGIDAVDGVNDLGGNRAKGNGDPAQCSAGIAC